MEIKNRRTLHTSLIRVKCFTCKMIYPIENVIIDMTAIYTEDAPGYWAGVSPKPVYDFIHYEVGFVNPTFVPPNRIFIEDLLCVENHCSVWGVTDDSMMVFAIPFLAMSKSGWFTKPDNNGSHFAMKSLIPVRQ